MSERDGEEVKGGTYEQVSRPARLSRAGHHYSKARGVHPNLAVGRLATVRTVPAAGREYSSRHQSYDRTQLSAMHSVMMTTSVVERLT